MLYESFQNNNNINNHNSNINNININESNFNLFPNISNANNQINHKKEVNLNKVNNPQLQRPIIYLNPYLLQNQMNQQYNLMRLNYINQMQKKNINNVNNIYMPFNNVNNSNNINNKNNYYDLIIDLNSDTLKMLDKENLIDIILFIRDICKVKIEDKFTRLSHKLFKIYKKSGKNEYLFSIKNKKRKLLLNKLIKDNKENIININNNINEIEDDKNNNSISEDKEEKDNIINENNIVDNKDKLNNGENKNNISNLIFCQLHQKLYFSSEYEEHLKSHLKCQNCGNEFKSKKAFK